MNNKDEKTFADLFLGDNDGVSKDIVTFGDFTDVSQKEEPISFNSFSDIVNNSDDDSFSGIIKDVNVDTSSIKDDDISSEKIVRLNNDSNDELVENNTLDLVANVVDDNYFDNNNIEQLGDEVEYDNEVIDNDNDIEKESVILNSDTNTDNTFNAIVDVDIDASSNNEVLSDVVENDNKVIDEVNEVEKDSIVVEREPETDNTLDASVFGFDASSNNEELSDVVENDNKVIDEVNEVEKDSIVVDLEPKTDNTLDINVFGFDTNSNNNQLSNKVENNKEVVVGSNEVIKENDFFEKSSGINPNDISKDKKVEDKKNGFDSPFFEVEDNKESSKFDSLFAKNISLNESSKTKKNVGKIELGSTKNFNVKVVPKNEPLIKFVVGVISYAFFIWLLLIGITLLVYVLDIKIRAAKGDYSAPTFNAYVVLTGSMLPDIQVNDVVVTKKVEAESLEVGDIITFASADSRFAGTIITHRIIKINPSKDKGGITFQTKGDNNNVADSTLVPEANIYGKVILKIPKLGYLQEFLATDGGWIIVILIPCLTVISYDIVKLIKGLKRKKYDNIKVKK